MKKISPKNHKSNCHPEFISGSYQLLNNTPNWSDSEHTQSSQNRNAERFRMTNFLSRSVKSLRRKPCAALPLWLITDSLYLRTKFSLSEAVRKF